MLYFLTGDFIVLDDCLLKYTVTLTDRRRGHQTAVSKTTALPKLILFTLLKVVHKLFISDLSLQFANIINSTTIIQVHVVDFCYQTGTLLL